ncbi:fluoride efflux transporter CrcB [Paenibacillus marinisediminis]
MNSFLNPRSSLAVALGGVIGANIRYGISLLLPFQPQSAFPTATFAVNIVGACFLGWLTAWLAKRQGLSPLWKLTFGTGLAGALTTFSTFSLETVTLLTEGRWEMALLYQVLSIACGVSAAWLGYTLGTRSRASSRPLDEARGDR